MQIFSYIFGFFRRLNFAKVLLGLVFFLFFVSFFFSEESYKISVENRFLENSFRHWLGTDQLGRDFFSLLLVGAKNSILFSSIALIIGSGLGCLLAFLVLEIKYLNFIVEEINKIFLSIPIILSAILIYSFYKSGWLCLLAISFFNIPYFYYLTKNILAKILIKDYYLFSRSINNNYWNIYRLHFFPQIYPLWLVHFSIQWGVALLMEAGLSYLGLGIPQPTPSLGRIIYENRSFYEFRTELIFYPGLVLFLLVIIFQYFADNLEFKINYYE